MNWRKLNPWNWFKHEESFQDGQTVIPVQRESRESDAKVLRPESYIQRELDRFLEDVFETFSFPGWNRLSSNGSGRLANTFPADRQNFRAFFPDVNVSSDDDSYTVTLEAAGLTENDISVELVDGRLLIKGNKQEENDKRDNYYYRIERRYGQFQRVLDLPADSQSEDIRANMANGLLTIHLPRKDLNEHDVRRIDIEH